jgi:hypothetical protein
LGYAEVAYWASGVIAAYGDTDDPMDICLECEECGEVILDAKIYTVAAREK